MKLFPEPCETIEGISRAVAERQRTCVDVLEGCLARIEEWEPKLEAWVSLDRDGARNQAQQLDDELASGKNRGPLHGIPVGIKDIIDAAGFPTACGSDLWAHRLAYSDAPLVARLRAAGAIILGKTVTTQYAWVDPPLTRNPWNLDRTPGGSSSGSAAAVATGMCVAAIGSQTGGSIIRPASFCGVFGYKPTHGRVAVEGILPFAPSLDHPGPLARSVADLAILYDAIGPQGAGWYTLLAGSRRGASRPPAIGIPRAYLEPRADAEMVQGLNRAIDALREAGAEMRDISLSPAFDDAQRNHRTIMASEAACGHYERFHAHPEDYQPRISELIREGLATPAPEYLRCRSHQQALKEALPSIFRVNAIDALLTPATIGAAPDRSTTGDPIFNSPWSYTGSPALSIPFGFTKDGMPLALQLVGEPDKEFALFKAALWCEAVLRDTPGLRKD